MAEKKELLSLVEAARRMGYATTKSIKDMIKAGTLSAYKYPHKKRTFVSAEEIASLQVPILISERTVKNGDS
jgi:hypothetical protein